MLDALPGSRNGRGCSVKDEDVIIIKHRLEQARQAVEDALFLFNGKRTPQSIINRAYYAIFYATLALLQESGKIPTKHTGVISLFDTEFVVPGYFPRELSREFHEIFKLRQISDYKITDELTYDKAQWALESANRFVEAVKNYLHVS